MKKQSLFMLGLLVISTVFSLGCMNREPAPVCPVPTELKQTDPGLTDFDGVDILVVVDNSNSMEQEQAILATAFFPLVNTLIYPLPGDAFQGTDNIRIAITTSDMGVSYNGESYDKDFSFDPKCEGKGNNGDFISQYISGENEVPIESGVIPCGANALQCPPNWVCADVGADQIGRCEPAAGDDNMVNCPRSPDERNMEFVDRDWDDKALAVACLANVGTTGCNFEQQLSAAAAGLKNTLTNDGTRSTFLRERKVTTIIIVSDEEDCSLKDDRWHSVPELGTAETNLACGKHTNYLFDVDELKDSYEDSVRKIVGTTKGLVFAAIVGVPPNNSKCEGIGENLDDCGGVKPGVNGTQTMEDPQIVEREVGTAKSIQNYYEFACQRWADGTSEEDGDEAVTSAYPGMRFVNMAQEFGENGYVYSICHDDWSPAMNAIAGLIAENLGGSCFEKRLNWDPDSETAGCNVVFEYRADRSESAPECPSSGKWIDKGELTVDGDEWVRKCSVEKIPTAITCSNFTDDQKASISEKFGWYYCENPGENNSVACNDGLDNDRDGKIDFEDSDCDKCKEGNTADCPTDCPYKVSLTETALAEASLADDANVVCLQQYRFEDPNCKESTRDACNDGEDNDGNGPFDCWSYAKGETIPNDQNPKKGARNADPDCCPMTVSDGGVCQFVDFRGNPVSDMAKAAYIDTCDVGTAPRDIPDSCCEAAKARLCRLPDDLRDICDGRESGK